MLCFNCFPWYLHFIGYILTLSFEELAISQNDSVVTIYKKGGNKFEETATLTEHGQQVTGIDWAPKTNRIVTCGAVSTESYWKVLVWSQSKLLCHFHYHKITDSLKILIPTVGELLLEILIIMIYTQDTLEQMFLKNMGT